MRILYGVGFAKLPHFSEKGPDAGGVVQKLDSLHKLGICVWVQGQGQVEVGRKWPRTLKPKR